MPNLILTRKQNEVIVIDGDIRLTIYGIERNQVRIGIDAPKNIQVHREEIWEKLQCQKEAEKLDAESAATLRMQRIP